MIEIGADDDAVSFSASIINLSSSLAAASAVHAAVQRSFAICIRTDRGTTCVFSSAICLLVDELVDADDAKIDDDGAAETAAAPRSVPHELGRFLRVEPDPGDVDIVLLV